MPMQVGDVLATLLHASPLQSLIGYRSETGFRYGIAQFVEWFKG